MRKSRSKIRLPKPFAAFNAAGAWVHVCLNCFCVATFFFMVAWPIPHPHDYELHWRLRMTGFPAFPATQSTEAAAPELDVHLSQSYGVTTYTYNNKSTSFDDFAVELASHERQADTLRVRISYDDDVPYQSYIFVLSECQRNRINHLEMVTSVPLVMVSQ